MLARVALVMLSTLLAEVLGCWSIASDYPPPSRAGASLARRLIEARPAVHRADVARPPALQAGAVPEPGDSTVGREVGAAAKRPGCRTPAPGRH